MTHFISIYTIEILFDDKFDLILSELQEFLFFGYIYI